MLEKYKQAIGILRLLYYQNTREKNIKHKYHEKKLKTKGTFNVLNNNLTNIRQTKNLLLKYFRINWKLEDTY